MARILRRVLETWGDLLSLKPSANTDVKNSKGVNNNKLKECEKKDKYLDLARELKNYWTWRWQLYQLGSVLYQTVTKGLQKGQEDIEVGNIIENGQNAEKSPGDLKRLAVTQILVKDHQLMLMWKTLMSK